MTDICMEYTLRVACLQLVLEHRALHPKELPPPPNAVASSSTSAGNNSSNTNQDTASITNVSSTPNRKSHHDSLFAFDFGSLMGRDSSKSPKYPEKMLKVLDGTLQRVAMGQEPRYSDQRFRRTIAFFWSSTWPEKTFQRQCRESRKIEDLILAFVTAATKSLKKEEELLEGAWKYELGTQVSLFLDLLHDAIRSVGPVPTELGARLDGYRTRLKVEPKPSSNVDKLDKDKVERPLAASSMLDKGDSASIRSVGTSFQQTTLGAGSNTAKIDSLEGSTTDDVAQIFGLDVDWMRGKLQDLLGVCTEQAALDDLKTLLKRLNTDSPFPYSPYDFNDTSQWTAYRQSEVSTLSQMMLVMMQNNPFLSQSSDSTRASTGGELASRVESLRLDSASDQSHGSSATISAATFTYVPPDPRAAYRELLARCLDWDLEILKTLPEDEDVSLGILSPQHVALLQECATRWRLPSSFRSWVFLDAIVQRAEQGLVPTACIHEATGMVGKISAEMPVDSWAVSDQQGLQQALSSRDACLFSAIANALTSEGGYLSPEFQEAVEDWFSIEPSENGDPDFGVLATSIAEGIRVQAFESYIADASERIHHEGGTKTRGFAVGMASWIESQTKRLSKRFGQPITKNVDVVPLVLQQYLRLWFRDLEDAMSSPPPPGAVGEDMEEAFALYRRATKLVDMGNAFLDEPVQQNFAASFEGTVKIWLDQTALKTRQWADQALAVDTFEPATANGPSSSVTDLFESFRSASNFLMDLDWPDDYQLAAFATRLAKIFSLSIHDYCTKMEQLFGKDMIEHEEIAAPPQAPASQKAWMEKAKAAMASFQGEKKIQPFFNFVPESCVKLNNIEVARQQLDKLYQDMRVDDLAAYDTSEPIPKPEQQVYLFTVKIVGAEGISLDGVSKAPDSFVILSDEHGNRYAKTRTILDDPDPRWDETFDIPVQGMAWFMCTVRHRVLTGKHELLGRAYLRLDPSQFADLISKDVLLPLDSRGHILLRISMEGERDDIQFHFGRAFRWLKRTESDMVRTFVDKMSPVLRHTLSRSAIKSVLKPASSNTITVGSMNMNLSNINMKVPNMNMNMIHQIDYNEALGKLTSAYRNAMGTPDYAIPPPPSEIPPVPALHSLPAANGSTSTTTPESSTTVAAKPRPKAITDAEIESAIHPLFDYLDANNHTLATTLSRDAMQMVMAKLWKQILMTIEGLIVPPLSDKPSPMRALSDGELDIALKWLKFLRDFFYVGGDESGVPLGILQNQKFNEILSVRIYYDWKTDDLMEECIRGFQNTLKSRALKPSKSLISQRNLGTIRARKSAKRALPTSQNNTEMIMRILRMRSGTQEFLAQQLQTISMVKLENPKSKKSLHGSMNRYSR